jgi:hypothetical protein
LCDTFEWRTLKVNWCVYDLRLRVSMFGNGGITGSGHAACGSNFTSINCGRSTRETPGLDRETSGFGLKVNIVRHSILEEG